MKKLIKLSLAAVVVLAVSCKEEKKDADKPEEVDYRIKVLNDAKALQKRADERMKSMEDTRQGTQQPTNRTDDSTSKKSKIPRTIEEAAKKTPNW